MPQKHKEPISHTLLRKHLDELKLVYDTEIRFHPTRLWRFDFHLVDYRIAIEIDGGIWMGKKGGHTSGVGIQRQMDKRNVATMMGYRVLVFSSADVLKGRVKAFLKEYVDNGGTGE